jgi:hypothetical protein
MNVHDEIVFDLPKKAHPLKNPEGSNLGKIRELRKLLTLGGDDYGIPTPVGVTYHDHNWGTGVKVC